jgi:hypothetical protein
MQPVNQVPTVLTNSYQRASHSFQYRIWGPLIVQVGNHPSAMILRAINVSLSQSTLMKLMTSFLNGANTHIAVQVAGLVQPESSWWID